MGLRKELRAGPPDPQLVGRLKRLAEEAIVRFDEGLECAEQIDELHAIIGGARYEPFDFHAIASSTGAQFWAEVTALGDPPIVPDLSRDELVDTVGLIIDLAGTPQSDYYRQLFCKNVQHEAASDLIYWPNLHWPEGYEPTAEEIVDVALGSGTAESSCSAT